MKNQIRPGLLVSGIIFAFLATGPLQASYHAEPDPDPALPRVLLIGDSIMGGYIGRVRTLLDGVTNVDDYGTGNHLLNGLAEEVRLIVDAHGPYDVIHFNDCGLHAWQEDRQPESDAAYRVLLQDYVDILETATDHIIWATTTCMTTGSVLDPVNNPTIVGYNENAAIVMTANNYPTVDLYGLTTPHLNWKTDAYHWNGTGYQTMANAIAPAIIAELPGEPPVPPQVAGVWAHYSFDSDFTDSSGNARHGTLVDAAGQGNSAIITTPGNHKFGGGAMDFSDDRDYLSIPTKTLSDSDGYTIAFWAQKNSTATEWNTPLGEAGTGEHFLGIHGSANTFLWSGASGTYQGAVIYSEDFETGYSAGALPGQNGWTGGAQTLVDVGGNLYVDGGNTETFLTGAYTLPAGTTELVLEARMFMAAGAGDRTTLVGLTDSAGDALFQFGANYNSGNFRLRHDDGSSLTANTGDANAITATGAWYDVRITLDLTTVATSVAGTFEVRRDGEASYSIVWTDEDLGLSGAHDSLAAFDGLFVRTVSSGDESRIDDLTLTVEPEPPFPSDSAVQHSFAAPSDTAWHHYAIVADGGGNLQFYLDGGMVSTATGMDTGFVADSIGDAYSPDRDFDMQGRIDEVWILDGAADADAIADLYNTNTPPAPVMRVRVFLIGGQSNADGRADATGLPTSPVNLQEPQNDVSFITRIGSEPTTFGTLRPGLSQNAGVNEFGPAITLGRSLADLYREEDGTRIAIIKYAKGGTSLESHWKGGGDGTTTGDGPEYLTFQDVVTDGLALLAAAYPLATIAPEGMLWVQGESDVDGGHHNAYENNLTTFIADVRATYGADLPFTISRLSSGQTALDAGRLAVVQAAQDAVAAADPRTAIIDTDGYGLKPDALHFDAVGQQALGYAGTAEAAYHIWMLDSFAAADIDAGRADPAADPDKDGRPNSDEFLALTDPLSGTSYFRASITLPFEGTAFVNFLSSTYRDYAIEEYQIPSGTWTEILPAERGTGSVINHAVGTEDLVRLFRVRCFLP